MVFFQCAGCGSDCKKNQVEKHKVQCRRSDVFSCIDCSVEFQGQAYTSHTRCMSESQKYEAKGSTPAAGHGQSKGDAKQVSLLILHSYLVVHIQDCIQKSYSPFVHFISFRIFIPHHISS